MADDNVFLSSLAQALKGTSGTLQGLLELRVKTDLEKELLQEKAGIESQQEERQFGRQRQLQQERIESERMKASDFEKITGKVIQGVDGEVSYPTSFLTSLTNLQATQDYRDKLIDLREKELNIQDRKVDAIIAKAMNEIGKIPSDKAGQATLAQESLTNLKKAKNILFKADKQGNLKLNRSVAMKANVPFSRTPFLGRVIPDVAPFSESGQDVNRWLRSALTARKLLETGQASTDQEQQSLLDRFMVNYGSNAKSFYKGINELRAFHANYLNTLTTKKLQDYESLFDTDSSNLTPEEKMEKQELERLEEEEANVAQ